MKRGLLHIDWVISFGIFVVFLLLMFIWFGPALTEEYNNEYLKDIAEKGFKEAAFATVWEYPVFIEVDGAFPQGDGLGFGVNLPNELIGETIEKFSVVNGTFDSTLISRKKISSSGDMLYFARDDISNFDNYSIKIIYSESFNVPSAGVGTPAGHEDEYNATIGVKNTISGFSENKFNNLSSLNYEDFKIALKYPPSKDISVFIYDRPDFGTLLYNYSKIEPTNKDNVYVVKWTDYVVDEYGNHAPVIILIKTW
jgi:hypothetical protein